MKLTDIVLRLSNHIRFHRIPGNILIGKHRIWPSLTQKNKRHLLRRIDTEINNMKYISRPFISQEESKIVYDKLLKESEEKKMLEKREQIRANKNKIEDRLMSDHLNPLRYHRKWE